MYEYSATCTRVVDGDTYEFDIDLGFYIVIRRQRVRLLGVDTPEVYGRNRDALRGPAASDFAKDWFVARSHVCTLRTHKALNKRGDEKQSLNRWLAEVIAPGGESLADALREAGHEK